MLKNSTVTQKKMASGLLCSSQCSLLLFHHPPLEHSQSSSSSSSSFSSLPNRHQRASSPLVQSSRGRIFSTVSFKLTDRSDHLKGFKAPGVLSADSRSADSILTVDSEIKGVIVDPDASGGGGEGGLGDSGGKGGGGDGGGGDSSGGGGGKEGPEDSNQDNNKKEEKIGMSMSQKLTLGYAALVGAGGVMGFVKTGSQKSLIAGGLSASILYYVYTQLPSNPVLASSVGLGVSAALLGVMGLRFKNSGKIFPAGVLSLVSLVMTAGYLHGIMRSVH